MAMAKLCACACGGAVIGGGAVHVAEKPRPAKTHYAKASVKKAAPVVKHFRRAVAVTPAAPCAPAPALIAAAAPPLEYAGNN
jgi:hypothetical protein